MLYNLEITTPSGKNLIDIDLDPDVTALQISQTLPGGYGTLTVGLDSIERRRLYKGMSFGFLPKPFNIKGLSFVRVWRDGAQIFDGRITQITRGKLGVVAFKAAGHGLTATSDVPYETTDASAVTSGMALEMAIMGTTSYITCGDNAQISDPGISHVYTDYNKMKVSEMVDQIGKEGDAYGYTYDFWVDDNRVTWFQPRIAPQQAYYEIDMDDNVTWVEDYDRVIAVADASYTVLGVEFTATGTAAATYNYDIYRKDYVRADEMTATGIAQFLATYVAKYSQPVIQASINLENGMGLRRKVGGDSWVEPQYLAKVGRWVKIADQDPLIIVETTFDAFSRTLQVGLGTTEIGDFLGKVLNLIDIGNKNAHKINLITGGKWKPVQQQQVVAAVTSTTATSNTTSTSVGTNDGVVADVGAAFNQTTLNNNFKDLSTQANGIDTQLTAVKTGLNTLETTVNTLIARLQAAKLLP